MADSKRIGAALVIGISRYPHDGIAPLKYAARDARALAQMLTDPEIGGFDPERVKVLSNQHATREAIIRGLSAWLPAQAKDADLAFIFFAGHGVTRQEGDKEEGYLLPFD